MRGTEKRRVHWLPPFPLTLMLGIRDQSMRWMLLAMVMAGIFSACANVSRFEKKTSVGHVVAYGAYLNNSADVLYYSISIKMNKVVGAPTMGVFLKLTADAAPLLLSELRPESVAKYLPRFAPPPQWPEHWKKKAMETESYSGGGFHITFNKGSVVYVGICSHCSGVREHPVIGTADGNTFYSLPLTWQQLKAVFGPADRETKVHEVRY